MKYVRIQARYTGRAGKPVGVFGACHHLKQRGILTEEETRLFEEVDGWFDVHLPTPPFYADGNPSGAITWFKSTATELIRELEPLMALLRKHKIAYDIVESDDPGHIVYEDDYQVGTV